MNNFITVPCQTFTALFGLLYLSILEKYSHILFTLHTTEVCPFHLWDYIWCSDYNSSERDESIDLFFTNIPHNFNFTKIPNCDHQSIPLHLFKLQLFWIKLISHNIHFLIQPSDNFIKAHNHFSRKVNKLKVQIQFILFQVHCRNIKNIRLHQVNLRKTTLINILCCLGTRK